MKVGPGLPALTPRSGTMLPKRARPSRLRRLLPALKRATTVALGLSVCSAAAGGSFIGLARAKALAITSIEVEGVSSERGEEIRSLLNVHPGDNLLFADLASARIRAESHPWVASAVVKRELPDVLRVVVTEKKPAMVLALDRLYYLDPSGVPFKAIQPGEAADLPVLTGLAREDLLARPAASREAIRGALELLSAIAADPGKALSPEEISEISWDEEKGYTLSTVGPVGHATAPYLVIRFGNGDWTGKLDRLREVRAARNGFADGTRTVDLTFASRVIVAR